MNAQNKGLNEMAQDGWTPTKHGESLDCYNRKSMGGGILNHSMRNLITQSLVRGR